MGKLVWTCCTASILEDFGGSQGFGKSWRAIPTSSTQARLTVSPPTAWPWLNPWVLARMGSGMENTLLDSTLLTASPCATHCVAPESSFTSVIISTGCCFPADLTLTSTAAPDTHANKSFVSHAESTFLIAHSTLLTAYPHKLRRCNYSKVPPLIQRFSWNSLTFVL